jgi:hypothetical protein
LAGGGIKPGIVHEATDEIGFHAVENQHYVTIFTRRSCSSSVSTPAGWRSGRKRLDIDHGKPIAEIVARAPTRQRFEI